MPFYLPRDNSEMAYKRAAAVTQYVKELESAVKTSTALARSSWIFAGEEFRPEPWRYPEELLDRFPKGMRKKVQEADAAEARKDYKTTS